MPPENATTLVKHERSIVSACRITDEFKRAEPILRDMSDAGDTDDIEEVREHKLEELRASVESDQGPSKSNAPESDTHDEPIHLGPTDDFQSVVAQHDVILADFYADWCGPCEMLEPVVEDLAATTDATVLKVDVDEHQQLAGQHGVRGVPTLLLVVDGEVAERLVGVQDESRLRSLIERHAS